MKFFGTVALIQVVSAACGKDAAGAVVETCELPDNQCFKMELTAINVEVYKEGADGFNAETKVGDVEYKCIAAAGVDAAKAASGTEVVGLTMTATESTGSSAIMMKGAIAAAALGLISYM
tara:strand:+ start:146 stop:505 length:360 start_codon:yes stop_codon:yes gene_type:complete